MTAKADCIFCAIAAGRAPAYIVRENERAIALLDIYPLARGHCLVIPKRHVPWWHDLTAEETGDLFKLAQETAQEIIEAFRPDFVAMYARGRRIPHTHIFLVPTSDRDPLDRYFNALEGFQESVESFARLREPKELAETMAKLKR